MILGLGTSRQDGRYELENTEFAASNSGAALGDKAATLGDKAATLGALPRAALEAWGPDEVE